MLALTQATCQSRESLSHRYHRAGMRADSAPPRSVSAHASTSVSRAPFGTLPDGARIERFTLVNARGTVVCVLTYGGIVQRVELGGVNVVLGFDDLDSYTSAAYAASMPYYGAIIGRYGNRIAGARFTLDGRTFALPANNGPNSLHGGELGFHVRVWEAEAVPGGVRLTRVSPDGECGFPGSLDVAVTYTLDDEDRLGIAYVATTDAPTVVNLTNHSYWNLAGGGTIDAHELRISASRYTPVDDVLIPTGELAEVAGTRLDFRSARRIGDFPYDHNWVLDGDVWLRDPASGRTLTITTSEPGVQVYAGDALDAPRSGLALETQHFPDSPNRPGFPSTVLRPGETFSSSTTLVFGVDHRP
jgi:aldose 1-epimerase